MARSPVEIQADIALTRRRIEAQLDNFEERLTGRGLTMALALGGAFVAGIVLAQLPLIRMLRITAGTVRVGATVAGTLAALGGTALTVERLRATPPRSLNAA